MRTQWLARAGRRLPLESRTRMGSARLLLARPLLDRQWLPAGLLARAVGPLPRYALSRPPSQRRLEALIQEVKST